MLLCAYGYVGIKCSSIWIPLSLEKEQNLQKLASKNLSAVSALSNVSAHLSTLDYYRCSARLIGGALALNARILICERASPHLHSLRNEHHALNVRPAFDDLRRGICVSALYDGASCPGPGRACCVPVAVARSTHMRPLRGARAAVSRGENRQRAVEARLRRGKEWCGGSSSGLKKSLVSLIYLVTDGQMRS